jgi:8-oxo-dGTP pyrophosphatase MutT (NUDIX family)
MSDWPTSLLTERMEEYEPRSITLPGEYRRSAVAAIVREGDLGAELFFIQRAEHPNDPWSGHMAFPGGGVEQSDASAMDAAKRETREEVAVDLDKAGEPLGRLDDIQARSGSGFLPMVVTPYVFKLTGVVKPQPNEEVQDTLWIPVKDLLDGRNSSTMAYNWKGRELSLPCFRVAGKVIWGLTYQMVMHLFGAVSWEIA